MVYTSKNIVVAGKSDAEIVAEIAKWTPHQKLQQWLLQQIRLTTPERFRLIDGSETENAELLRALVHAGVFIPLNPSLRPNSYLSRSPPSDVARVEERTYICANKSEDAGPTNNWYDPTEMKVTLTKLFAGCMKGRTLYAIPFCMGPLNSPFSKIGIEVSDSAYVAVNMRIMTRMGNDALRMIGTDKSFIPCMHTVGAPLEKGQADSSWPCNPTTKYISHFPQERAIWSYGSGYGGNALLGKKCFALRIASVLGRDEGWLAEHMLIVGLTPPGGVKTYITGAFPSACGKTNLAMLEPTLPGWKVETVGDDIAWLRIQPDGRLWAVNPECGFFGVAPGTSMQSNPNAIRALHSNSIFTNCAMTPEGDVYWEKMSTKEPAVVTSWLRTERYAGANWPSAHANSRFTCPARQCPVMDADWEKPEGVPVAAMIFGGRRSNTMPLVFQARSWAHGVFIGASMTSETTAAAFGAMGVLRNDPFAMLPFCGYNMADYWGHWLTFDKRTDAAKLPKVFMVNWFRKSNKTGQILWPGFGDNIRVLDWIIRRSALSQGDMKFARETPIGFQPAPGSIDMTGLGFSAEQLEEVLSLNEKEWLDEAKRTRAFFSKFGNKLPKALLSVLDDIEGRFGSKRARL